MKPSAFCPRSLLGLGGVFLANHIALGTDLSLSIQPTGGGTAKLQITGANGKVNHFEATRDFHVWTNWVTPRADGDGQFTMPLLPDRLFLRAVLTSPGIAPEAAIGKRLFLEPRFAQFFFAHNGGDVNAPLSSGDPVLDETATVTVPVSGAFAGQSMNCRACHLLDEQKGSGLGYRAYADFAIRSPIPDRGDGRKTTFRNSPALANASIPRPGGFFLHYDGEFPDGASLVKGTLTGRNFGWLPSEHAQAVAHIARVIREDNGEQFNGPDYGGAYRAVLSGTEPDVPSAFRISLPYRLDITIASDAEILDRIGTLLETYLKTLRFSVNSFGEYEGSPYDLFLKKNFLPRQPRTGEDDISYSRRLRGLLTRLSAPEFVTPEEGSFNTQAQSFSFGAKELEGLLMFLAEPTVTTSLVEGKTGNCIACHAAPHFTDFDFHNTGATQWEYDAVHGEGAFAQISIPSQSERLANPNDFLPATVAHPHAKSRFLAAPATPFPGFVDLGLWNVFANEDFLAPQPALQKILSARFRTEAPEILLPKTVALFKTPGLRDIGQSAPYMHTGQSSTIESLIFFYRFTSDLVREQSVRNPDPEIGRIFLTKEDAPALAAFLRSLNQDLEEK